ncbi:MAG TPA: tripartite tricarboxylate transporter substrate binding protein [Burkholderiales bacterium]|nr:tripartite tricarboxylate transporter substrate binding protein [Burkholderiales bacterium]
MKRLSALALLVVAASAAAQDYPSRPIHIVVPYTPGTGADILSRVLGPKIQERWHAAVVTDNKPGAGGNIGAESVARAPADGYTFLLAATSFSSNPTLSRALPYDPVKSFSPVVMVATSGLGVYVHPSLPVRTLREFIAYAKQRPGKLYYSSPGTGNVQHLAMELLKQETGIDIVHVPYKGAAGAVADLVGGQVQATVAAIQSVAPHVHSGRLRMLAIMSAKRSEAFPDVPTLAEQGLPDIEVETWYGLLAPAGTPEAIVARWNAEVNELMKEPELKDVVAKQGLVPAGGTSQRFAERIQRELARWSAVVKKAGIKAE